MTFDYTIHIDDSGAKGHFTNSWSQSNCVLKGSGDVTVAGGDYRAMRTLIGGFLEGIIESNKLGVGFLTRKTEWKCARRSGTSESPMYGGMTLEIGKFCPAKPPLCDVNQGSLAPFPLPPAAELGKPAWNYRATVAAARSRGLPTSFLEGIQDLYTITTGPDPYVEPELNVMVLPWDALSSWQEISKDVISLGLNDFYHEATHAFLHLEADNPKFSKFISEGSSYYEGAPLENGKKTTNPHRLLHEAAAVYVSTRVSDFYTTLTLLRVLACDQEIEPANIPVALAKAKSRYDDSARSATYGYEPQFRQDQVHTTRDMSSEMKNFLNKEILEGKIPHEFDRVDQFRALEKAAMDRVQPQPQ